MQNVTTDYCVFFIVFCLFVCLGHPFWLWPAYLYTWLWQVDLEGHFLPHEDIWVAGFGEKRLQDVQLCPGEGCALSALLPGSGYKDAEGELLHTQHDTNDNIKENDDHSHIFEAE